MPKKKKKNTVEFLLFISPQYDETRRKETTLFLLETTKEFSTFKYSIVVKETVQDKTLRFEILGLKTPEVTMPAFGPARKKITIDDLHGTYDVVVTKLDGMENHFTLKVSKRGVAVDFQPAGKFVLVFTDLAMWKTIHEKKPEKIK